MSAAALNGTARQRHMHTLSGHEARMHWDHRWGLLPCICHKAYGAPYAL